MCSVCGRVWLVGYTPRCAGGPVYCSSLLVSPFKPPKKGSAEGRRDSIWAARRALSGLWRGLRGWIHRDQQGSTCVAGDQGDARLCASFVRHPVARMDLRQAPLLLHTHVRNSTASCQVSNSGRMVRV